MKVYFLTLGCRVNQYETDALRRSFLDRGHELAEKPEYADCCVVNTCSVTSEADRKSGQMLRRMARLNPDTIVVAAGCSAETTDGKVNADIIAGTRERLTIVDRAEKLFAEHKALTHEQDHVRPAVSKKDEYHDFGSVLSPEGCRAFMKIEDGCDSFCTYCIIPFARGRVASRNRESCIKEAEFLAQSGYREIIVSGIHLCSYGKDRGEDIMSLASLLKDIDEVKGIERLRLGSLEPISMTDEFIDGLAGLSHICPSFHLSLQSGSDTVLKRMNRHYDTMGYASRVERLRARFPDMSLTTDIIVGFPGETDEEFEETMRFAEEMGFARIHVFPYSLRKGTKAAEMEQVAPEVKKERETRLLALASDLSSRFAKQMKGREESILVEKISGMTAYGYTENYVRTEALIGREDALPSPGDIIKGTVTDSCGAEIVLQANL